ncbi:MAG: hypothetical protein ACLP6E_19180 [Acidimicrobiales bacterium]
MSAFVAVPAWAASATAAPARAVPTIAIRPSQGSGGGGISSLLGDLTSALSGLLHLGGGAASGAAGDLLGFSAAAILQAVENWVTDGALWLLDQVGAVLTSTTQADLGSSWFGARLSIMTELAASVMLPMLFCAVIQAVYRQSVVALLRTFLVNLPVALLFTGVAVELVRMGIVVTDAMSAKFMAAAGVNTRDMLAPLVKALGTAPGVPGFAMFLGGLLVAVFALVLWLELVVRAAAITAAALFLPLVLAALVWPAIGHWARRLADTLAALVLSKLVIAAVLSLATAAIAGGLEDSASTTSKFGDVVVGIALLLLATFSPFMVLRLLPMVEAGSVGHLEAARHRLQQAAQKPVQLGTNMAILLASGGATAAGGAEAVGAPEMPIGGSAPLAEGSPWLLQGWQTAKEESRLAPIGSSVGSATAADSRDEPAEGRAPTRSPKSEDEPLHDE